MVKQNPTFIYHITHLDNLASIVEDSCLWSDRRLAGLHNERVVIGYDHIKQRRLEQLPVHCHSGTKVGDFVPFYFCPRSPMLFKIWRCDGDLAYKGGQDKIIHLVSTVDFAVKAAAGRPWAFSDGNAGAEYTQFRSDLSELPTFVNWNAVNAKWWRGPNTDPSVMSKKMAEFLVHDSFPWTAIAAIGVIRHSIATELQAILANANYKPQIVVKPEWYY